MAPSDSSRDKFLDSWPTVLEDVMDSVRIHRFPDDALEWFERNLVHNTPGGKLNRATSVIDTLQVLKGAPLSPDEFQNAAVLGWCVELLQACFLVSDDMMDRSLTRRGQPCWYRMPGVGNIAINDALLLEAVIFVLLKKYFRQSPIYINLVELFHDVAYQTELGQLIDLLTAPEDHVDLEKFSFEKHHLIVVYKTAFYSFYLPVALAMRLHGLTSPSDPLQSATDQAQQSGVDLYVQAKEILLPIGEYFQVQDDYLDCFGDPDLIGKIGTDILDNKCSWNINVALKYCTDNQRQILNDNYGKKNPQSEAKVKQVFNSPEVNLKERFEEYESEVYTRINKMIEAIDESQGLKRDIFRMFLAKIYKRQK